MGGKTACPKGTAMKLAGLLAAALDDPALAAAKRLAEGGGPDADRLDLTAPTALRPFVVGAVAGAGRPVLAITATSREAEDLAAALGCLLPPGEIAVYPSWETLPHERLSPRSDTVGRRLAVLRRLAHPEGRALRPIWRTSSGSSPTWPTPGSIWWRSAASSRSAVASSTCSRRPRSTRCGWSSGATRSRRSARSRWPTSAPSHRSSGCGRRRAGSCC